jgi:hypothetical protein
MQAITAGPCFSFLIIKKESSSIMGRSSDTFSVRCQTQSQRQVPGSIGPRSREQANDIAPRLQRQVPGSIGATSM